MNLTYIARDDFEVQAVDWMKSKRWLVGQLTQWSTENGVVGS